jgi:hypothetical protein
LAVKRWWGGVLVACTQFGNALCGGNPDEMICGRIGKAANRGHRGAIRLEAVFDLIFALIRAERDHCRNSIEEDEA